MKTFRGKSANQILNNATIAKSGAGLPEIWYNDMIVNALEEDDQIYLRNAGGLVAAIDLTPRAKATFDRMVAVRDRL